MSLSKDIQQREFKNEYQKALINILYTENYLVNQLNEVFKEYDITRQQYNVLRILRGQYPGPASVNLIKERMLDKMSDTSRIVERLRIKGLISRDNCESDKRSVEIRITPAGLEMLEKMQQPVESVERLIHTLTEEEARQLNQLLDKLRGSDVEHETMASTVLSQSEH